MGKLFIAAPRGQEHFALVAAKGFLKPMAGMAFAYLNPGFHRLITNLYSRGENQ
jgi:hypothetical protein